MKLTRIVIVAIIATLSLCFTACSDEDSPSVDNGKRIVGVWKLSNYGYGMSSNWQYVRFLKDGNGYFGGSADEVLYPDIHSSNSKLTWSFTENGNTLIIVSEGGYYSYSFENFSFLQNGSWSAKDGGTLYIYEPFAEK